MAKDFERDQYLRAVAFRREHRAQLIDRYQHHVLHVLRDEVVHFVLTDQRFRHPVVLMRDEQRLSGSLVFSQCSRHPLIATGRVIDAVEVRETLQQRFDGYVAGLGGVIVFHDLDQVQRREALP